MNSSDTAPTLPDGTTIKMGCLQPEVLKFSASPAWDDANPVLSEEECLDTDRLVPFLSPRKTQHFNNCTNAAMAGMGEALMRMIGIVNVPTLSMSFNYCRNNGGRDQGAFCRDLADEFRKVGMVPDADWPEDYDHVLARRVPQEVVEKAGQIQALEIYQCLDWSHVRSALARDFFVYHGFVLGNAFFRTGKDGKVPSWDGRLINGHAMFSCGLTRRFGDLRTITPNSWGDNFGENGIGYLDKSYFWGQNGSSVNLDAFAFRAMKRKDPLPTGS